MTAEFSDQTDDLTASTTPTGTGPEPVRITRNVTLAATVGGLAALLAFAFAVRAFDGGATLDWLCLGVLVIIAAGHLLALIDARAPLMVVDEHGVRVREGARWQGIAWPEVECLEHLPRRGLRDGHLLVVGYDEQQLIVPLTLAARVAGASAATLSDDLAALAAGRADVVEVVPGLSDEFGADAQDTGEDSERIDGSITSSAASDAGEVTLGEQDHDEQDHDEQDHDEQDHDEPLARPDDLDATALRPAVRADIEDTADLAVTDDAPETSGAGDDDPPGARLAQTPAPTRARVLAARVEHASTFGPRARSAEHDQPAGNADTMTVVLDDLALRPAAVPVIGPQLAAARERLRLSIDQLSERTRIRPHVIEAIEVDDFGPCGGDFYARGHLRTMARVLGVDAADLVATYDATYADAPVDPRRVFESELATGVGGSIRTTRGGRNWSVLIAGVMAAVLVWSLAQLLMGGPTPVGSTPVLSQTGSGGIGNKTSRSAEVHLTLTAAGGGANVLVRDGGGDIVFDGQLAFGQTSELDLVPPVRITSSDGSVTASLDGAPPAALGATGEDVSKTLVAP